MTIKGNKGEWSELYVFLKLLGDGCLFCSDGQLNRYDEKFYPILEIFRDDSPDRNIYKVQAEKNNILVSGETISLEVSQERFKQVASQLLESIKSMKGTTSFLWIEPFLKEIDNHNVKAKSSDKADIRIIIHNLNNGTKPELGYSIKSKLGAGSTLINAGKDSTNFIYKVQGISDNQVNVFNSFKEFKHKFAYIQSIEATIAYQGVASLIFHNNLTLLDLGIERILAESLLEYYFGQRRTVEEIVEFITRKDPLGLMTNLEQPMYAYKVKQFLLAFALGVTPSKPWTGKFNANGGYIVVKEDGDIVCYHFFDRNDLEDYLFYNTRFETPSTSRHGFGKIYQENGEYFLKLNLQVRFK